MFPILPWKSLGGLQLLILLSTEITGVPHHTQFDICYTNTVSTELYPSLLWYLRISCLTYHYIPSVLVNRQSVNIIGFLCAHKLLDLRGQWPLFFQCLIHSQADICWFTGWSVNTWFFSFLQYFSFHLSSSSFSPPLLWYWGLYLGLMRARQVLYHWTLRPQLSLYLLKMLRQGLN